MKWTWRGLVIVALLATHIWIRGMVASVREECRINRDRAVRLERLVDEMPTMIRAELARHRNELIAWMEARHDD